MQEARREPHSWPAVPRAPHPPSHDATELVYIFFNPQFIGQKSRLREARQHAQVTKPVLGSPGCNPNSCVAVRVPSTTPRPQRMASGCSDVTKEKTSRPGANLFS